MRLVIGEDEALLRHGLTLLLRQAGFDVLAVAADGDSLVELTGLHRPDMVITDVRMPPTHTDEGMVAARIIAGRFPEMAIVVLSQHVQRRYALELLEQKRQGIGYLLKQRIADVDTFCDDLRRVHAGGTVLDPEVVAMMMSRASLDNDAVGRLTPRQLEVLELVAQGRSNAAIAAQLVVTEKAVVQHTSRIYDTLGLSLDDDAHRRVLAVLKYLARDPDHHSGDTGPLRRG